MRTNFEFIHFKKIDNPGKSTSIWVCIHSIAGNQLGIVRWEGAWWRYTFHPNPGTSYDSKCNRDIADFMEVATEWQRKLWREKSKKKKGKT